MVTGQLHTAREQAFVPIIFDQDETDFIMRPIAEIGYHFKDQVSSVPVLEESEKLEVLDQAMAGFVADCLVYWVGYADRRRAAHMRNFELVNLGQRPAIPLGHQINIRNDIAACREASLQTKQLLGKLGTTVDYLQSSL